MIFVKLVFDIYLTMWYLNTIISFLEKEIMVKIHINIPKETRQELKVLAASKDVSLNALVGDFIERCLLEIKKEAA
jgi:hypothetical protein